MDSNWPSEEQWLLLLDLIANDEEVKTGVYKSANGKVKVDAKWDEVAVELNKKPGARKTGDKWREAFAGLRSRARKAYRLKTKYKAGTGGGPPPSHKGLGLSEVYERTLDLVGVTAAAGNSDVPDALAEQLLDEQDQAAPTANVAAQRPVRAATAPARRPARASSVATVRRSATATSAAASSSSASATSRGAGAAAVAGQGAARAPTPPSEFLVDGLDLPIYFMAEDGHLSPVKNGNASPSFGAFGFNSVDASLGPNIPIKEEAWSTNLFSDANLDDHRDQGRDFAPLKEETRWSADSDIIVLDDSPEVATVKSSRTPPRGSGLTPSSKRRLYTPATAVAISHNRKPLHLTPTKVQNSPTPSDLAKQLRLTREAIADNTTAVLQLSAQLRSFNIKQ